MDLITLEEYKTYKKISNPERDDILRQIVSSVSSLIKTYCGRSFVDFFDEPKTEIKTIKKGMNAILLSETPIKVVSGVTSNGVDISNSILIDKDMGIVFHSMVFPEGPVTLGITYTGGYEECPADIKLAAFELVDYYLSSEHTSRKTLGGGTIEFQPSISSWPFHIQSILDMYRDV